MSKLSPPMIKGLQLASQGALRRVMGGDWIGWPEPVPYDPDFGRDGGDHIKLHTMKALEQRGLIERLDDDDEPWHATRVLTDAGRVALAKARWS